jgi:hypothetical protein
VRERHRELAQEVLGIAAGVVGVDAEEGDPAGVRPRFANRSNIY